MNDRFQPVWLRFAVIAAVVIGVLLAWWLFGSLASGTG
jgi:hypothetical protein